MLLSIAFLPLVALRLWHHHYGKIAVGWALLTLVPLALLHGPGTAADVALHTLVGEYVPFIIFIGALYVVAGGIYIQRQPARHAAAEHRDPRARRRAGELHGHDRRSRCC